MHTLECVAVPARVQNTAAEYPREVSADGTLQHSRFCQATSTKWDWSRCAKCAELMCETLPPGDPIREMLMRRFALAVVSAPVQLELVSEDDLMYPLEVNRDGTTAHAAQCTGGFGRYDVRCHRCQELQHGRVRRGTGHRRSRSRRLAAMVGWLPIGS